MEAQISGLLEIKLGRIPGVDEGAWEMRLAENSVESNTSLSSSPPPPLLGYIGGMWDVSSLTRGQTHAPGRGSS